MEENSSLGDEPLEVFESILDLELTPGLDMLLGSELEVASVLPDNRVKTVQILNRSDSGCTFRLRPS